MKKWEQETIRKQLKDESQCLKDLEKAYQKAKKDCQEQLRRLNSRKDMQNLQSIIYQKKYQTALLKQIDGVLNDLQTHTYKTANEFFQGSYQNGYIGSMYELQKQGIPFTIPVDPKKMVKAIQTDSKISKDYYLGKGLTVQNIRTLKKQIALEATRGIASGQGWLEVAESLAVQKCFQISLSDAMRICRTEGNRINQQARLDAGDEAVQNGCDILKQWDATLDGKTRPAHQEADGQIREWGEDFIVMGEKLPAPSVGGSASNVCNCRCQLLKRPRWALDDEELEVLKKRAEYYGLDKTKNFEEYREKFLKLPPVPVVPFEVLKNATDFRNMSDEDFLKWEDAYKKYNAAVVLTDEELQLIEDYSEGDFHIFNGIFRGNEESLLKLGYTQEDIERFKKRSTDLSNLLSKYNLHDDIVTHRFEKDVSWLTGSDNSVEALQSLIGQDRSFQGFTSSSLNEMRFRFTGGKKDAVHFEILTPKGTDGAYLFQSRKGELEFLYNKNTKFRILDGGERTVKEKFFNIKTNQMDERDIVERFLKIQVYPTKTVDQKALDAFLKSLTVAKPSTYKEYVSKVETIQKEINQLESEYTQVRLQYKYSSKDKYDNKQKLDDIRKKKAEAEQKLKDLNKKYIDVLRSPDELAKVKKGDKMSFEKADTFHVNPNYGKSGGYSINCQSCVPTFEARLRGYDVTVKENKRGSALDELSRRTNKIWIDPSTGGHPEYIKDDTATTPKKYLEFLKKNIGSNGERYSIEFAWKGAKSSGHIVNLDRTEDGKLRIKDNQRGKGETSEYIGDAEVLKYLSRMKYQRTFYGTKYPDVPKVLRIDNMGFNLELASKIMEGLT